MKKIVLLFALVAIVSVVGCKSTGGGPAPPGNITVPTDAPCTSPAIPAK